MVEVKIQAETIAQDLSSNVIHLVEVIVIIRLIGGVIECIEVRQHLTRTVRYGGVILGREILELPIEARDAPRGGIGRCELREVVNEVIARRVQQRRLALCVLVKTHKGEV